MTDGTEYGCLDCIGFGHYRTWQVEEDEEAMFCPYCGNRSFIEAGEESENPEDSKPAGERSSTEWDEILERDDVQK